MPNLRFVPMLAFIAALMLRLLRSRKQRPPHRLRPQRRRAVTTAIAITAPRFGVRCAP